MSKRGFSLIEITMTMALIGLMSGVAVLSFHRSQGRSGPQGLAMILAEELRRARQDAVARRRPTALVLPTAGGNNAVSRSFYILEGETRPRITGSRSYAREYAGADLFVGKWGITSGTWSTVAAAQQAPLGSKWNKFDWDQWLQTNSSARRDSCFIFLPDGTLRTNGLPAAGGSYHLVVAAGAVASGTAQSYLVAAGEAFTINISPVGSVEVQAGLWNSDGSVVPHGTVSSNPQIAASPVVRVTAVSPENADEDRFPNIVPTPDPSTLNPGNSSDPPDASITKDQYVSLVMQSKSPSGEQLFCNWTVRPPSGFSKKGRYSIQSDTSNTDADGGRMEWNPNGANGAGVWEAVWQWHPPDEAQPGEIYTLNCAVQNLAAGDAKIEIQKRIVIEPPGCIFFESDRAAGPGVYSMDTNGQRQKLFLPNAHHPSATVAGDRIVFVRDDKIFMTDRFKTLEMQLTPNGQVCSNPVISANGSWLAYLQLEGGVWRVHVKRPHIAASVSSLSPQVAGGPIPDVLKSDDQVFRDTYRMSFDSDGQRLFVPTKEGGGYLIYSVSAASQLGFVNHVTSGESTTGIAICVGPDNKALVSDELTNGRPYDPWVVMGDDANAAYSSGPHRLSLDQQDTTPEREPRARAQFLLVRAEIVHGDVTAGHHGFTGHRQICRFSSYLGYQDTAQIYPPNDTNFMKLTEDGNNFYPSWTVQQP